MVHVNVNATRDMLALSWPGLVCSVMTPLSNCPSWMTGDGRMSVAWTSLLRNALVKRFIVWMECKAEAIAQVLGQLMRRRVRRSTIYGHLNAIHFGNSLTNASLIIADDRHGYDARHLT